MFEEEDKPQKTLDKRDIPKECIKTFMDEFWQNASDKERNWLEIEFKRHFPEFQEWLKKNNNPKSRRLSLI